MSRIRSFRPLQVLEGLSLDRRDWVALGHHRVVAGRKRIAAAADGGEVLTSRSVVDSVDDPTLRFDRVDDL
jgi:hypothetical protein